MEGQQPAPADRSVAASQWGRGPKTLVVLTMALILLSFVCLIQASPEVATGTPATPISWLRAAWALWALAFASLGQLGVGTLRHPSWLGDPRGTRVPWTARSPRLTGLAIVWAATVGAALMLLLAFGPDPLALGHLPWSIVFGAVAVGPLFAVRLLAAIRARGARPRH